MKQHVIFLAFSMLLALSSSAQFVAKMEVKEDIPGLCDKKEVYVIFPMLKDQEEAVPPINEKKIEERLNEEVSFLKDNPKFNGKGMIGVVINCDGKMVKCEMDNSTKNEELDKQIEAVFATLTQWKPGVVSGRMVDTNVLFSFEIKKGKLSLN